MDFIEINRDCFEQNGVFNFYMYRCAINKDNEMFSEMSGIADAVYEHHNAVFGLNERLIKFMTSNTRSKYGFLDMPEVYENNQKFFKILALAQFDISVYAHGDGYAACAPTLFERPSVIEILRCRKEGIYNPKKMNTVAYSRGKHCANKALFWMLEGAFDYMRVARNMFKDDETLMGHKFYRGVDELLIETRDLMKKIAASLQ